MLYLLYATTIIFMTLAVIFSMKSTSLTLHVALSLLHGRDLDELRYYLGYLLTYFVFFGNVHFHNIKRQIGSY